MAGRRSFVSIRNVTAEQINDNAILEIRDLQNLTGAAREEW
jgi:hypothetical protein